MPTGCIVAALLGLGILCIVCDQNHTVRWARRTLYVQLMCKTETRGSQKLGISYTCRSVTFFSTVPCTVGALGRADRILYKQTYRMYKPLTSREP